MTQTALLLLALAPAAGVVQPVQAQTIEAQPVEAQAQVQQEEPTVVLPDVEVTAARRGVALGGQEPIVSYDAAQIQAFGATNIGELITLLEAQTRSARGGSPVFLVNGRRISGFREIRGIPPEAIERFDVLPEETALSYGYSANQRVVNIVLKADFKSLGRLPVSWIGWTGNSMAMPPASRMPSRTRSARTRWWRLHGDRSEPVWAMPMIGLSDCSSLRVRP